MKSLPFVLLPVFIGFVVCLIVEPPLWVWFVVWPVCVIIGVVFLWIKTIVSTNKYDNDAIEL